MHMKFGFKSVYQRYQYYYILAKQKFDTCASGASSFFDLFFVFALNLTRAKSTGAHDVRPPARADAVTWLHYEKINRIPPEVDYLYPESCNGTAQVKKNVRGLFSRMDSKWFLWITVNGFKK